MKQKTYVVKFDWKGDEDLGLFSVLKGSFEGLLVSAYHLWATEVNRHIDDWNKESEALGLKPDQSWDCEYMKFMWMKHHETLMDMCNDKKSLGSITQSELSNISYRFWLGEEMELHMEIMFDDLFREYKLDLSFHLEEEP